MQQKNIKKMGSKNAKTIIVKIEDRLSTGKSYVVKDFGTFGIRKRATQTVKNPQNGKEIHIRYTKVPYFKADKKLKEKAKQ